ncbi:MAG: DUF4325 domain-containing protein [Betaproteobacteria bacterium]|nr:DUF4325 domain-containing protein [Betaproteobacteria bacterium]
MQSLEKGEAVVPVSRQIILYGDLNWHGFQRAQKLLHARFETQGFADIELRLDVGNAYPNGVIPLVLLLESYRQQGREIGVVLPEAERLVRLFASNDWIRHLDPRLVGTSGVRLASALHSFGSDEELNELINREIDAVLGRVTFAEGVAQAFEWTLNEIAGNVLVHSGVGAGLMQVVAMPQTHHLAIVVADRGTGIPETIRRAYPDYPNDEAAIEHALQKGVTSRPDFGQGKGLTGALEIVKENNRGRFEIHSGKGYVGWVDGRFAIKSDFPPFPGTVVDVQLDTAHAIDVSRALWGHQPVSFTETLYGAGMPEGVMRLSLRQEAASFGNRITAARIRTKIENLLSSEPGSVLEIDFSGVDLIASSFADEIFGKLAIKMGVIRFSRRLRFLNLNNFCHSVTDDVVQARMAQHVGKTA